MIVNINFFQEKIGISKRWKMPEIESEKVEKSEEEKREEEKREAEKKERCRAYDYYYDIWLEQYAD